MGLESEDLVAADADADVELEITYNARASRVLSPGGRTTVADEGEKWLVVRMDVTNAGEDGRELAVAQDTVSIRDEADDVVHFEDHFRRCTTVRPDETVTGWIAFSIPEDRRRRPRVRIRRFGSDSASRFPTTTPWTSQF